MFDMSSGEDCREQLREWREDNSRHSDEIIQFWEEGLELGIESFEDEKWMVIEQVTIAAMDTNRVDIVNQCMKKLIEKFGASSLRIRRLQAMMLEMVERWDEAIDVLDSILEEDVANSSARKRKIAIYKSQGETDRAVRELVKYLGVFMSDQEAWMELCDLYTSEQDYSKVKIKIDWTGSRQCHIFRLLTAWRSFSFTTPITTCITRGMLRFATLWADMITWRWPSSITAKR